MDITFKKDLDTLKKDVTLKSVDLKDNVEDFEPEIQECSIEQKAITISPECVRCNLCVQECPVDAISEADASSQAKILENCVKCEICAETCPVKCINVIKSTAHVNDEVTYEFKQLDVPHRVLKMKEIEVDPDKCNSCGTCVQFCPTGAITLNEDGIANIDKELCIGCGACVNVCEESAINLERELGPIISTKKLDIDQDACVECQMCEESCPVDAIKLEDGKIILDEDKCILCEVCSTKCPVSALKLERLSHES
ncbi:MAG: 4Fe-4S binding protein [Methanomicrobiales archaeon]